MNGTAWQKVDMNIPSHLTIGPHVYRVVLKDPGRMRYGTVNYQTCVIKIRPHATQQAHTFWHELTHAILHEMHRDDLARDEGFVSDFGRLLHRAIKTASFA